jgi:hypothetical protein
MFKIVGIDDGGAVVIFEDHPNHRKHAPAGHIEVSFSRKTIKKMLKAGKKATLELATPTIGDWKLCLNADCPSAHVVHEHDSRGWYRGPEARGFA